MKITKTKNFEIELRGFLPKELDKGRFYTNLLKHFEQPDITDELTIFFKYDKDVRVKLNKYGLQFVLKQKPIKEEKSLQEETIVLISTTEAENFLKLLDSIGYKEGLFSYCVRHDYSDNIGNFSVKFQSVIGDFWEFEKNVEGPDKYQETKKFLNDFAVDKLELKPWSDEEYKAYIKEKWADIKPERILIDGKLHPLISSIISKYVPLANGNESRSGKKISLADVLKLKSNDYSYLEKQFEEQARTDLLSKKPIKYENDFLCSASIIIPVYNSYETLEYTIKSIINQNLTPKQFKQLEVIVSDDGSNIVGAEALYGYYKKLLAEKSIKSNFIRSYDNKGRACARNLGAQLASGDVLFFIDADVVLSKSYIKDSMVRHQFLDKIVLVGFKENIEINDKRLKDSNKISEPNIFSDFRFKTIANEGWTGLYPVKGKKIIECMKETDCFKKFSFGKICGPFDLSCMVVSHNISLRKKEFERVGGFNVEFGASWGFEDTFLGSKLVADNNFIVPLLSSGIFHIELINEKTKGVRVEKTKQLLNNFQVYKKFINQPFYPLK